MNISLLPKPLLDEEQSFKLHKPERYRTGVLVKGLF
jgi:hypothetical protein